MCSICAWQLENYSSGCDPEVYGFGSTPEEEGWSSHQATCLEYDIV